jgi:excisionase family DNA binding protein
LRVLPEMLLTIAQVAVRLCVNRETVYRLVARGELAAARVGTVLRIAPRDLAIYLARMRVTSKGRSQLDSVVRRAETDREREPYPSRRV